MLKTKIHFWPIFIWAFSLHDVRANFSEYPYYPQLLRDIISEYSLTQKGPNTILKDALYKTLSYQHLVMQNGPDSIFKKCPSGQHCYRQRQDLGYREAREILFGKLHLENDNTVIDLYCGQTVGEAQGAGPMKIPDSNIINCEHTWPQSRFNPRENIKQQKTDLHHLFPVFSRANSSRQNLIFADVDAAPLGPFCPNSRRGHPANFQEAENMAFEPPDDHKGNVARAIFYFSIRYHLPISSVEEEALKRWNASDPVDESERQRNEEIFRLQKNRNPFIDWPKLVELIDDF